MKGRQKSLRSTSLPLQWLSLQLLSLVWTKTILEVNSLNTVSLRFDRRISWSYNYHRRHSNLFGTTSATTEQLLRDHGFGQRLRTLTSSDLPVTAELHDHGTWEICRIVQLEPPNKLGSSQPRLRVQVQQNDTRIVDLGQITTVWNSNGPLDQLSVQHRLDALPMKSKDNTMQAMYHSFSHRPTTSRSAVTKKSVSKIIQKIDAGPDREHAEEVLRKILKAGEGMIRLVDSLVAMNYLYDEDRPTTDLELAMRQSVGGLALAQDASLGGRFKRMSCTFVSARQLEDSKIDSITFINGGWIVVDSSVRSGTEARKFAQRSQGDTSGTLTEADERIAHRLECLALGEVFGVKTEELDLEVDVREFLKAFDLPTTPQGAQRALVRIGRWSENRGLGTLEPWSNDTLNAAKEYAKADLLRRRNFSRIYDQSVDVDLEGRVDMTSLPTVCIDAATTTFRDDAIGIRPRSMTGRKVVAEASNWEILIHIADVSDIYCPEQQLLHARTVDHLRAAALLRAMSRYDLPLGPLHLLPPVLLKSLGFATQSPGSTCDLKIPNRCVSLWAYIDERNGKLLDVGLERTLISTPLALTYESASKCLSERATLESHDPLFKVSAILALAERNLQLWSNQYKKLSVAARKREERLSTKALMTQNRQNSFDRTRGHRLVDMGLDLYGVSLTQLFRSKQAPIPRASGSGSDRMGRVATAPLRRYVDGMAQRQALSVLCNYGGPPLTVYECRQVNAQANDAMDRLSNIRPLKRKD